MGLPGLESLVRRALGNPGDAASAAPTASAQAKLAWLRPQAATYMASGRATGTAANTVIADSGPLSAGEYEVMVSTFNVPNSAANPGFGWAEVQHRDATNATNVRTQRVGVQEWVGAFVHWARITLAANERIRLYNVTAASADHDMDYSLVVRPV